jgi:hypothetical protein
MIQSFDDVDEKREILNKMTGTAPGESGGGISVPLDVLTPRVKKDHPKPAVSESWRDRVQQV